MNPDKSSKGWTDIRHQLKSWSKPALLALVKDLYEFSADNRDFLHARFQAEVASGAALEQYRGKIIEKFFPKRGFGKLRLGEARKAIRDYRKATGNLEGTIDLLLTYVENGTQFTREFGDINEPFYNSLDSALEELVRPAPASRCRTLSPLPGPRPPRRTNGGSYRLGLLRLCARPGRPP